MSLPTTIVFYHGKKEIGRTRINVGWFMDEDNMPREVREAQDRLGLKDEDWVYARAYGVIWTKPYLNNIILKKQGKR